MTLPRPDDWHPGHMRQHTFYTHAIDNSAAWSMSDYPYPVTLDWYKRPSMQAWNEICAWTIEHFGLPGHRYQTEVDTERMTWYFQTKEDQMVMIIAWGHD